MITQRYTKSVPVSVKLAKEISELPAWKGDRPRKKNRIDHLRRKLKEGLFHPPSWTLAWHNGTKYRLNGGHSSFVLATSDFPTGLEVQLTEYEVTTEEELATLWAQYDAKKSSRSDNEVINAAARVHTRLSHVSPTNATNCAKGIAFAISDGKSDRTSAEEQQQYVHEYTDFFAWANPIVCNKAMKRASVIAAIFRCWQYSPEKAWEFWCHVRDESHPDNKNASRLLGRFLRDSVTKTLGFDPGKKKWPVLAFYVKSIIAFNAYMANARTDLKFYEGAYKDKKGKTINLPLPTQGGK